MALKTKMTWGVFVLCAIAFGVSYFYPIYKEHLKWKNYFHRTHIDKPNPLVSDFFESRVDKDPASINVLDLGAGNGSDSIFLLNKGYQVYALDFHEESIKRIKNHVTPKQSSRIHLMKVSFQNIPWNELPQFDVILTINAISFIDEKEFWGAWRKMKQLKPQGGIIARLFGDKIKWPNMNHMTLLTPEKLQQLTQGFELLQRKEEFYQEGETTQHAYNLVLRKSDAK